MSAFKGTPGPWEVEEDGFYESSYIRQKVATRRGPGFVVECRICENVDNDDDARLIAAAPELLEALKDLFDRANHHTCTEIGGWFTGNDENYETLRKAEQAIAKATGGDA